MRIAVALSAAVLAAAACRGEDRAGDIGDTSLAYSLSDSARPDSAPPSATPSDSAPTAGGAAEVVMVTAADSAAGDSLFRRQGRCFTCHGAAGEGIASLGPSLLDGEWLQGDGSFSFIARTIATGVATPGVGTIAMPAFEGQLTPEEIRLVSSYVYALSHPGAVVADSSRADSIPSPSP